MRTRQYLLAAIGATLWMAGPIINAAEPNAGVEAKLREAVKNTMLQLRDVQTQLSTLQGTQAELEEKKAKLEDDFKKLKSKTDAEKLESDKAIERLNGSVTEKEAQIAQLKVELEKAKAAFELKDKVLTATEEKRKAFEEKSIMLDRRVADQQAKNQAMYKIGIEILNRYEKFGLGDALTAREPFIGATRVKFENLVQDFQDKLTEQKLKPVKGAPPAAETTAAPANGRKGRQPETSSKQSPKQESTATRPRD